MTKKKIGTLIIFVIIVVSILFVIEYKHTIEMEMMLENSPFSGSRTGNDEHFIMDFEALNSADGYEFSMLEGEKIKVHIEKKCGDLDVVVQNEEKEIIFEDSGDFESDFIVEIKESGTYYVEVKGKKAQGEVSFQRIEN